MILYILQRIENSTDNYHSQGGLVVLADDDDDFFRQLELAKQRELAEYTAKGKPMWANEFQHCTVQPGELAEAVRIPVEILGTAGSNPTGQRVWIFPDAGCC